MHDIGSNWTMSIFTRTTAITASGKVLTFTIKGTHKLENLRKRKVVPKNYSAISVMLVWAVENIGRNIKDREHLWLPSAGATSEFKSLSSLGLLTTPGAALTEIHPMDDCSGQHNSVLLSKQRKLSRTQNLLL
ncbi:hypothetical protein HOY80DRAFT_1104909 [Tuber brumale]|nr:hypothetical protein HOY80DRAFT_1104909 [Tuber brumale]